MKSIVGIIVSLLTVLALAGMLLVFASNYLIPSRDIRLLAVYFLLLSYNPKYLNYTAYSPQIVTAILWDYRGYDTLYETLVFYLAVIGTLALMRHLTPVVRSMSSENGLSVIVKTVTRISSIMILSIAVAVALHGHLTPGGGFQAGSIATVVSVLLIIVFSQYFLLSLGLTKNKSLFMYSMGLTGIGLVSIALFIVGLVTGQHAYIIQNLSKTDTTLSFPTHIGGQLISGSLWFLNFFEFIAVMFGFALIFIILTTREEGEM